MTPLASVVLRIELPRFGERKLYRICWQTIFISGKPQWYGKPLTQLGFMSGSGGHSSIY